MEFCQESQTEKFEIVHLVFLTGQYLEVKIQTKGRFQKHPEGERSPLFLGGGYRPFHGVVMLLGPSAVRYDVRHNAFFKRYKILEEILS